MVTTLSTRTSVLGVTNPTKGAFKHGDTCSGVATTSLSGPLLSRFDIVLLLLDQHEPHWDAVVSEHVLTSHQQVGVVRGMSVGSLAAEHRHCVPISHVRCPCARPAGRAAIHARAAWLDG
jgi:DNA replicative helicase MCM subunit Mcm2 (Cdc46/Mcm family)